MEKYTLYEGEPLLLGKEDMELLKKAITDNLVVTDKFSRLNNSYGYKHMCERYLGFYVSNEDLKEAMYQLGIPHRDTDKEGRYTYYPIQEESQKKFWEVAYG